MSEAFKTETIEHAGQTVRIEYFYDDMYRPEPWAECVGNVNIKTKSTSYYGHTEKRPSEVIFYAGREHDPYIYDAREAQAKALAEGWGCKNSEGLTKRQIAAKAVQENVNFWRGYLNNEWFYCGVVCTVLNSEGEETEHEDSCWGYETFNDYHETAARELAAYLAEKVEKEKRTKWRAALHEARQRKYWASRDVLTAGVTL